jgi:hypothetical protein
MSIINENNHYTVEDMQALDRLVKIANCRHYADHYGFETEFRELVTMWRRPKRRKAGAR